MNLQQAINRRKAIRLQEIREIANAERKQRTIDERDCNRACQYVRDYIANEWDVELGDDVTFSASKNGFHRWRVAMGVTDGQAILENDIVIIDGQVSGKLEFDTIRFDATRYDASSDTQRYENPIDALMHALGVEVVPDDAVAQGVKK